MTVCATPTRDEIALDLLKVILATEAPAHYYEPKLALDRAYAFADEYLSRCKKS